MPLLRTRGNDLSRSYTCPYHTETASPSSPQQEKTDEADAHGSNVRESADAVLIASVRVIARAGSDVSLRNDGAQVRDALMNVNVSVKLF